MKTETKTIEKVQVKSMTAYLPDFNNTQKAFAHKSNSELRSAYWLFKLMGNPGLVKVFSKLTIVGLKLHLPIEGLIKSTIFKQFCGGASLNESEEVVSKLHKIQVGSILDYSVEGKETDPDFDATLEELLRIVDKAKHNAAIPYTCIKITGIARMGLLERRSEVMDGFNKAEAAEWARVEGRLDKICGYCQEAGVPIYIDAEESWIQPAIDELAEKMMLKYNKTKAVVQTTLQLYRWDRLDYLKKLIETAKKQEIVVGVKLVRGAYWEKENVRAAEMKYKSPVHQVKADTDKDYNAAVTMALENIDRVNLCAGTHNEESTLHVARTMVQLGISPNDKRVYCSQLFGMSDHITYNVADAGFNVTKYLPYGPVKSVIPYLIRRAEENTSIAGQMGRELKLIVSEKKRREQI